ncbi:uncharacterized protein LOC133320911 [Musca vetustissima]|uniref:uncharacterized protein LOC133320911 n=1 Tax=Musca vetustissima TaxID=27455 RepID=UPI002AB749EA|nr:uncharacterized protein LOC133320911 [Musca vetustissima]
MAPKSKICKILTLALFAWLLIILLMNVFNSGHSYYYSRILRGLESQGAAEMVTSRNPKLSARAGGIELSDDDDVFLENSNNREPSIDELFAQFQKELPYVPFSYARRHENRTMRKALNCANFPRLQSLRFYNNYWQTYSRENVTFHLYGAYYDEREDLPQGPVVRILGLVNQLKPPFPSSFCQVWYENDNVPELPPIHEYKIIWRWGGSRMFFPVLITCPLAKPSANVTGGARIPQAVSIVGNQCDTALNILNVVYNKPSAVDGKSTFAVCVKGLDFPFIDLSSRLAEWLEMQRLLGAAKVFMYEIDVHPNVKTLLNYYEKEGFVEVRPITLVGGVVGLPHLQHWILKSTQFNKRLNELVPYNDCFYRHLYEYEYIALVDVDEIIMPRGERRSWHDIVQASMPYRESKNCTQGFAALCFRNTYFPYNPRRFVIANSTEDYSTPPGSPTSPPYMFFLNHTYRTSNYSRVGYATKCLHRTSKAVTLHNHYSLEWLNACNPFNVPEELAHLQHYHDEQPSPNFREVIADHGIERYRTALVEQTTSALRKAGLVK